MGIISFQVSGVSAVASRRSGQFERKRDFASAESHMSFGAPIYIPDT
jgi:hypothetical protein